MSEHLGKFVDCDGSVKKISSNTANMALEKQIINRSHSSTKFSQVETIAVTPFITVKAQKGDRDSDIAFIA